MRSSIFAAAACAVGAMAVPLEHKRAVVVETDNKVVYVTQMYTVTGGQGSEQTATAVATAVVTETAAAAPQQHYGHHVQWGNRPNWWGGQPNKGKDTTKTVQATWEPAPSPSPQPEPTTEDSSPPPAYTTPAASPAPSPSSYPSNGGSSSGGYSGTVVSQHNLHRTNHSAPDIAWSSSLASIAAEIASSCVYAHNTAAGGGGYGQNIAAGVDESGVDRVITDMFYNGEVNYYDGLYGQASPSMDNFEHWGHFSQIVWKSTTEVGCATQHCPNGLGNTGSDVPPYFTVCNYKGPGNMGGEYGANVLQPLGHPTVSIAS